MKFDVKETKPRVVYAPKILTITFETEEEEKGFAHIGGCTTCASECTEEKNVKDVLSKLYILCSVKEKLRK